MLKERKVTSKASLVHGRRGINFEPRMTGGDSEWKSRDDHSIAKAG